MKTVHFEAFFAEGGVTVVLKVDFASEGSLPDRLLAESEPVPQGNPRSETVRPTSPGHMVSSLAEEQITRL